MAPAGYTPPFDDELIVAVARNRSIVGQGETLSEALRRAATRLLSVDRALEPSQTTALRDRVEDALQSGRIALSSQLLSAANSRGNAAACTVLQAPKAVADEGLSELVREAVAASSSGMGCGIDVSRFANPARVAARINDSLLSLHDTLVAHGQRPPALMITCDANHPRAIEFVDVKVEADFSRWVANVSLRFDNGPAYEALRDRVAVAAHRNGEPGILFMGPVDADNPTPQYRMESTAPCAEVFMAAGERCVFVSVNLAAHVRNKAFQWTQFSESVALAVRLADAAVEMATAGASVIVADRRRIGIGVCGLHTALIALGEPFSTSTDLSRAIAERLVFAAHSESRRLAAVRGPFPVYRSSRWRDPIWIGRKRSQRGGAVTEAEWCALEADVLKDGVRNAVVVAYPPTGIVSELLGVSKSYEPHFSLRDRRGELRWEVAALAISDDQIDAEGQVPGASRNHLLACARQIRPDVHLAVHAAFSTLADEAGSKTINLPHDTSVCEVAALMDQARSMGLKGLSVFRDGCLEEANLHLPALPP